MQAWLESVAGPDYAPALMWTLLALVILVIVLVIIRLVRGLNFGTFVAGGRNRKTRLAVMDATAVDSHRRLVLVRRDDIEHLILIGGPTDVVVEQNIRLLPPARRAAPTEAPHIAEEPAEFQAPPLPATRQQEPQQAPRPAAVTPTPPPPATRPATPAHRPAPPQPAAEPSFAASASASAQPQHAPAHSPAPSTTQQSDHAGPVRTLRPVMPPVPSVAPSAPTVAHTPQKSAPEPSVSPAVSAPTPAASSSSRSDLDNALLEELQVSLERDQRTAPALSDADRSLDEEMSKLLSDLSGQKR